MAVLQWQDKVASLRQLEQLGELGEASDRRLQTGDYEDVVKTLLLMLGDNMVLVRTAAAACLRVLALGLAQVLPVCVLRSCLSSLFAPAQRTQGLATRNA